MSRRHLTTYSIVTFLVTLIVSLCFCGIAIAGPNQEVRLFVVEKSKNPQNVLVVYAKVDAACKIKPIADAGNLHLFDFYWLMDGTTFKPTHRLIKKAARKRFVPLKQSVQDKRFTVLLADLKELSHDLPSDNIEVEINRDTEGECRARAVIELGPTHGNRTIAIDSIYSETKMFLNIPVGIHYIELRGRDIESHDPIVARYNSNIRYNDAESKTTDEAISD